MRVPLCTGGVLAALLAVSAPAAAAAEGSNAGAGGEPAAGEAAPAGSEPPEAGASEPGGSVSLAFAGGLMIPRAELAETRSSGLTAGILLGLTHRSGLGLTLSAEYAPLPPAGSGPPAATRESHVGAATLSPRFTLGRGLFRTWLALGGGVLLDYEQVETGGAMDREFVYEPVASGALGVEVHAFDSGGFVLMGRYARSVPDPGAELITATGGLVLDF